VHLGFLLGVSGFVGIKIANEKASGLAE